MFVAPGAVDCSVMQKSAGFLYFTLQMAWCGNNGDRVKGHTALADLLEERFALGLMTPVRLHPFPVRVMPSRQGFAHARRTVA
jgi:hypothetical protein